MFAVNDMWTSQYGNRVHWSLSLFVTLLRGFGLVVKHSVDICCCTLRETISSLNRYSPDFVTLLSWVEGITLYADNKIIVCISTGLFARYVMWWYEGPVLANMKIWYTYIMYIFIYIHIYPSLYIHTYVRPICTLNMFALACSICIQSVFSAHWKSNARICMWRPTPRKFDMELENDGFRKENHRNIRTSSGWLGE